MVNQHNTPLTVYKASAGSGKTFTLTVEYIKLLIKDPTCYRNILAVTFTNKATEEMKMRILSKLYGLSIQSADAQSYMDCICSALGFAPVMVATQARTALHLLLHNYSYFRVETIDKFFQSVLRNMASELDLTANLRIDLNDKQIEAQAVDDLVESLRVQSQVFGWIMQYVEDNLSEEKNWNVISLIKKFGTNIFNDAYRGSSKQINKVLSIEGFFGQYTKTLRQLAAGFEQKMQHYAASFFDLLEENGVELTDFSRGATGVCSYFVKLRNGSYEASDLLTATVVSGMEDATKWIRMADAKARPTLLQLIQETLLPFMQQTEQARQEGARLYKSARLTLRHLDQLRLLETIESAVRQANNEANRFLLSDTQYLLNGMIQDSDSPFIFEKIGTRLRHIMIDEFQDTSSIQWKNFKVLLLECMSHEGTHNLIVGDVKQSIYRWRDGDWKLLNNISDQFDHNAESLRIESLQRNYRSNRNIIEFNNAFFTLAAQYEHDTLDDNEERSQLTQAYADVCQLPRSEEPRGWIEIELMPTDTYRNNIMGMIEKRIDTLLSLGYAPRSIAILCRSKSTIQDIADYMGANRPDLPFISVEAFRLDASTAVCAIMSALKVVYNPEDWIERAYLEQHGLLDQIVAQRARLLTMPLYEMIQEIYAMLTESQYRGQSAYILALMDMVSKFLDDHFPDIGDLINEWDTSMHAKTIQSSMENGISLLTIHKSKGLEYDHVILPACDWLLEQQSTLWCVPTEKPFDQMPLVPIDASKTTMTDTIYEADYQHEHLQNVVDNLNLLYVAFTRAKSSLYIYGKRSNASYRSRLIEQVMSNLGQQLNCICTGDAGNKEDSLRLEYGQDLSAATVATDDSSSAGQTNIFIQTPTGLDIDGTGHTKRLDLSGDSTLFRQSNQSKDFLADPDDDQADQGSYIQIGNVLHRVFASIHTTHDIDRALKELEYDGVLYDGCIERDKLIDMLRKRLANKQVSDWFSERWRVVNERTILSIDPIDGQKHEHRPDRVITDGHQTIVIDFKFGSPKPGYQEQVREYMRLLREIGHQQVQGYLWYIYSNKIEEVI